MCSIVESVMQVMDRRQVTTSVMQNAGLHLLHVKALLEVGQPWRVHQQPCLGLAS
jgi:hypothetical protein